jgi:hypothetical protein
VTSTNGSSNRDSVLGSTGRWAARRVRVGAGLPLERDGANLDRVRATAGVEVPPARCGRRCAAGRRARTLGLGLRGFFTLRTLAARAREPRPPGSPRLLLHVKNRRQPR